MRFLVTATVALGIVLPLGIPLSISAEAQTRLPRTSPAERKTNRINRDLQQEQRQLNSDQRLQVENNQIRQSIDQQRNLSVQSPSGRFNTCPAGRIGC
jgi:hypothetical protein